MRKEWKRPEIKNLSLVETHDEGCLYETELADVPTTTTLFPVFVWGDGKIGCTYWDCNKHGCINPNYGKRGKCWPCPPAKQDPVTNS